MMIPGLADFITTYLHAGTTQNSAGRWVAGAAGERTRRSPGHGQPHRRRSHRRHRRSPLLAEGSPGRRGAAPRQRPRAVAQPPRRTTPETPGRGSHPHPLHSRYGTQDPRPESWSGNDQRTVNDHHWSTIVVHCPSWNSFTGSLRALGITPSALPADVTLAGLENGRLPPAVMKELSPETQAVVASVAQGDRVRTLADGLAISVNHSSASSSSLARAARSRWISASSRSR
jgi:hypothetical protein